jgi:hypothetical protein
MPPVVQNTPSDSETSQLGDEVNEDHESKEVAVNVGNNGDNRSFK